MPAVAPQELVELAGRAAWEVLALRRVPVPLVVVLVVSVVSVVLVVLVVLAAAAAAAAVALEVSAPRRVVLASVAREWVAALA